jgi:tetratricopeptide (TPR) repeat protein
LVSNRSIDPESYQQYLRAKALVRARGLDQLTEAAKLSEQVVARHSDFAPGWAQLALAYHGIPNYHPAWTGGFIEEARVIVDASLSKAEAAARQAVKLDANLADGYLALGTVQEARGKLLSAEELYLKTLALDPNNPDGLNLYSQVLAKVGLLKEALAMRQRLQALEPFVPVFINNTAGVLWLNGQSDAAIAMLEAMPRGTRAFDLSRIYAEAGRFADAANTVLDVPPPNFNVVGGARTAPAQPIQSIPGGTESRETIEQAARLLRTAPAPVATPASLPRLGRFGFVYLYVGASDRVLEFYEGNVESGYLSNAAPSRLWHRRYASVRKTERFKAFARKSGLVEYWRAKGWPEFCRPVGADQFSSE